MQGGTVVVTRRYAAAQFVVKSAVVQQSAPFLFVAWMDTVTGVTLSIWATVIGRIQVHHLIEVKFLHQIPKIT